MTAPPRRYDEDDVDYDLDDAEPTDDDLEDEE
jgi:hypothetical protein